MASAVVAKPQLLPSVLKGLHAVRRRPAEVRVAGRSPPSGRLRCRGKGEDNDGEGEESGPKQQGSVSAAVEGVKQAFLSPRIDDAGLPLADCLIAGAIAPMCTAYAVLALRLPRPLWLLVPPGTPTALRGIPYLGPTFRHGAILASCWLVGALAGRAFEEPRYKGEGVLAATLQSGAFATGVLILVNQLTLAVKLGTIPALAELTPDTEILIGQTGAALVLDVVVEALFMTAWRLYRGGLPNILLPHSHALPTFPHSKFFTGTHWDGRHDALPGPPSMESALNQSNHPVSYK